MRLATVQSATTVRLEGATTDSTVWRSAVPLVAGDLVAVETFGTQLVVVSALESPRVGVGAGLAASTSQSIANATVTQMSFPVAAWDDGGWISGNAIVTPAAGRYLLTASAQFDGGNTTGYRDLFLYGDSASLVQQTSPAIAYWAATVSVVADLAAGVAVTARINQSSGGALSVLGTRRLSVTRLR